MIENFLKSTEIWNKITELIGISNAPDFAETTNDGDESITAYVYKNTSVVRDNHRNKAIIVLHSV